MLKPMLIFDSFAFRTAISDGQIHAATMLIAAERRRARDTADRWRHFASGLVHDALMFTPRTLLRRPQTIEACVWVGDLLACPSVAESDVGHVRATLLAAGLWLNPSGDSL